MIKNLENTNLIRYGWQEVSLDKDKTKVMGWGPYNEANVFVQKG